MWTLSPNLRLGFHILVVACCREGTESRNSWHLFVSRLSSIFFLDFGFLKNRGKLWLYLYAKYSTKKMYFSRIVLYVQQTQPQSKHCKISLYSFSFAQFLTLSSEFCYLVDFLFVCRFFFVIKVKNARTVSLESFFSIPFASTVLSNGSWRTNRNFTPLLSLTGSSTYAKSVHQIAFLNLASAFNLLNLRVVRVKLVYKGFERKNCLTLILVGW